MAPLAEQSLAGTPRSTRGARLVGPLAWAGTVAVATVALHVRDPHIEGSWAYCPWKLLTGLDCPGCGSLRAVNDLTNGDVVGAASSNLLLVLAIPFVVGWWLLWLRRRWTETPARALPARVRTIALVAASVAMAVFTVARNTGWGSWLHS